MKHLLSYAGAALAAILLSGCGGGGSSASPPSGPSETRDDSHSLGGTVSGLGNAGDLQLTNGVETISVDVGASTFVFPTQLPAGTTYAVSIAAQPPGKTCSVAGGTGTMASADVANIVVTCADQAFQLGGTIHGLSESGLVLTSGSDMLSVDAGETTFTMPAAVAFGSNYAVTVQTQPAGLACSVTNGAGVMSAADITGISITCTDQSFLLRGSIAGLGNYSGLVLANGDDTLNVDAGANGFTMPSAVSYGDAYSLTIEHAPAGLTCTVNQGSGSMPANGVTNIAVVCADQSYTVGGAISGLTVSGLVLANGSDTFAVEANATGFTMPEAVAFTSSYDVMVQTQPADFTCTVTHGSGTMGAGPVTDIAITCAQTAFTLGGTIDGLTSSGLVLSNGGESVKVLANATTFTMLTGVATGASYNVSVASSPAARRCEVNNGAGVMGDGPVMNVSVTCTDATVSVLYSFAGSPDAAQPQSSSLIQGRDGNFYGTTRGGGTRNAGAVFKLTPAGQATVLWSFGVGTDGNSPYSTLIQARDGNFYGTTLGGGAFGNGTVFRLTPAGEETVLWSFGGSDDGTWPVGGLLEGSDGNFYGITMFGGTENAGTVFRITAAGGLTTFFPFYKSNGGPFAPNWGGLTQDADGNLYALAGLGGGYGAGAVVKIAVQGDTAQSTFNPFGTPTADGAMPTGNLIAASDGNFYGATYRGGSNDQGTIFKLTADGVLTTLYSFQGGVGDGSHPAGPLIQANDGNLYGLTSEGGAAGAGTLFRVTLAGEETILHSFSDSPTGGLLQAADGGLYGMTLGGLGSVFQMK